MSRMAGTPPGQSNGVLKKTRNNRISSVSWDIVTLPFAKLFEICFI